MAGLWRRNRNEALAAVPTLAASPREVVVFSGGGSLGAAQVGAVQALFEAGIVPDAVVGCSIGAINAAYIAMHPSADGAIALETLWRSMSRREVFPNGRFTIARRLASRANYVYNPEGMRGVLSQAVTIDDLAKTEIPCHVVTTDLTTGAPTWWDHGDPIEVLSASACLPGLFPPVVLEGRPYVDGGVSCPVPTQHALDIGASRVWVLNISREYHGRPDARMSALDVLVESFAISRSHLGKLAPTSAPGKSIVSLPALSIGRHDMRDFSKTPRLIAAGREAGRAMVASELRARIHRVPQHVSDTA